MVAALTRDTHAHPTGLDLNYRAFTELDIRFVLVLHDANLLLGSDCYKISNTTYIYVHTLLPRCVFIH